MMEVATREEVIEEMDYRARLFQIVAVVMIIAGLGFGIGFGSAADQLLIGAISGLVAGLVSALPFVGIYWILEGQAEILQHR